MYKEIYIVCWECGLLERSERASSSKEVDRTPIIALQRSLCSSFCASRNHMSHRNQTLNFCWAPGSCRSISVVISSRGGPTLSLLHRLSEVPPLFDGEATVPSYLCPRGVLHVGYDYEIPFCDFSLDRHGSSSSSVFRPEIDDVG